MIIGRAETLRDEFPDDPTMLDDLERTPEAGRTPLGRRLGAPLAGVAGSPSIRHALSCWPSTRPARRSPSPCLKTSGRPRRTRLGRRSSSWSGPALPSRYAATGSRSSCTTSSPRGCITLAAAPAMPATSQSTSDWPGFACLPTAPPAKLTRDRAEWLAYHLVARQGLGQAQGSADPQMAQRIPGCHRFGRGVPRRAGPLRPRRSRPEAPDAVYHAVRAWLFAAHVRALDRRASRPRARGHGVGWRSHRCDHAGLPASEGRGGRPGGAGRCSLTDLDARLLIERA